MDNKKQMIINASKMPTSLLKRDLEEARNDIKKLRKNIKEEKEHIKRLCYILKFRKNK